MSRRILTLAAVVLCAAFSFPAHETNAEQDNGITEYILELFADSNSESLQRHLGEATLGEAPPQRPSNNVGENKKVTTFIFNGATMAVWSWKEKVYFISLSNSMKEGDSFSVDAAIDKLGEPTVKKRRETAWERGTTKLLIKANSFSWRVELMDSKIFEEAGGTQ